MNEVKEESRGEIGKRAEDIALDYLLKKGFCLRERNWRRRHYEIDLIMECEKYIHIVEVRSRCSSALISPKESVLERKQGFLIKAASSYLLCNNVMKEALFDIVSIVFRGKEYEVEYIPNAFLPFCRIKT